MIRGMQLLISSYNEGTKDYLEFRLYIGDAKVGSSGYLYRCSDKRVITMKVVHIIKRSDDMKLYDDLIKNDNVLINGETEYNADTSAEFIFDEDCYLVWFKYD